eukprot:gene3530-4031_t
MKSSRINAVAVLANICIVVSMIGDIDCHPTLYGRVQRNESCYLPTPAKIYSWHVHVLYNDQQPQMKKRALTLLEEFNSTFKNQIGKPCDGLFHQGRLCIFAPESAAGPFPVAQWAIFLPVDKFASLVPWFMQHRVGSDGFELDVLVHPNSGCEIEDHTWWSIWGGKSWRLNTEILSHDKPYPWNVGPLTYSYETKGTRQKGCRLRVLTHCSVIQMKSSRINAVALLANICIVVSMIGDIDCHPTLYGRVQRNESCYLPTPAKIYSWHVHVLYNDQQPQMKKQALSLLEKFNSTFKDQIGKPCDGLFHQGRLCIFAPESAAGPFPVAQWAIFLPVDKFASLVPWFMQHRVGSDGFELDVLVHPNSGCEIEDHTWWSIWGGKSWRLNTEILSHDKPYPWSEEEMQRYNFKAVMKEKLHRERKAEL